MMKIEKLNLNFRSLTPIRHSIVKIVCHHPAHPTWGAQEIHNYHRNSLGWAGIGYNYFVTFDGRVQEGRGRNVGAHVSGHNSNTLGVCFQGDFSKQQMTDAQVKSGAWLIAQLLRDTGLQIHDVIGHRDLAATACPGANFRMDDLRQAILEILNPRVKEKKKVQKRDINKVSDWAKEDWEEAVANGYFDGSRPGAPLTREEAAVVVNRLRRNFLKLIDENKDRIDGLEGK